MHYHVQVQTVIKKVVQLSLPLSTTYIQAPAERVSFHLIVITRNEN